MNVYFQQSPQDSRIIRTSNTVPLQKWAQANLKSSALKHRSLPILALLLLLGIRLRRRILLILFVVLGLLLLLGSLACRCLRLCLFGTLGANGTGLDVPQKSCSVVGQGWCVTIA